MSDTATETPTTQTEGEQSSAAAASLLSSTETPAATTEQPGTVEDPPKPADETPKPADEAAKPEGAPETYVFTAPEGKEYDAAVLDTFSAAAKEANLTQDAAQKLLEKMAPALADKQAGQIKAIQDEWRQSAETDKDFGGEKLQESLAVAKKAVGAFTSPELRKLLDDTGFANHPEVIRMFLKIGQGMSEDKFVTGAATAPSEGDRANRLYGEKK